MDLLRRHLRLHRCVLCGDAVSAVTKSEMEALLRVIESEAVSHRSLDMTERRRRILAHALRVAIEAAAMKFILVKCHPDRQFPPLEQFRATYAKDDGGAIDLLFWARDEVEARAFVLNRYPNAEFSDILQ